MVCKREYVSAKMEDRLKFIPLEVGRMAGNRSEYSGGKVMMRKDFDISAKGSNSQKSKVRISADRVFQNHVVR